MKKAELVKLIAADVHGVSEDKISKIINSLFENLANMLVNEDSYNHDKFGTFKVVPRAPRKGRNPKTGEQIVIPARKTMKFVISEVLENRINGIEE